MSSLERIVARLLDSTLHLAPELLGYAQWASVRGLDISHPIGFANFNKANAMGYGLRALETVPADTEIFRFPTEHCIAGTNFRELNRDDEERLYADTHAVAEIFFTNDISQL